MKEPSRVCLRTCRFSLHVPACFWTRLQGWTPSHAPRLFSLLVRTDGDTKLRLFTVGVLQFVLVLEFEVLILKNCLQIPGVSERIVRT